MENIAHRQIHKAVKNVLHNELNLTQEKVESLIVETVKTEVHSFIQSRLSDTKFFNKIVNQNISHMMKEGFKTSYYDNEQFPSFIKRVIEQEVKEYFINNFTLSITTRVPDIENVSGDNNSSNQLKPNNI